jgi:parallel beta-helix repeat protein
VFFRESNKPLDISMVQKTHGGNMNRALIIVLMLTVFFITIPWVVNLSVGSSSKTLVVPNDYPSIGAAVNQAAPGDVLLVKSGVYYENVQINKPLTLEGQDAITTIIVGNGGFQGAEHMATVALKANDVRLTGLTITSQNYSSTSDYAYGINIQGDNCTIENNIITNNYIGIFCSIQSSTIINNNTIASNIKDGIRFFGGSLNTVSNNKIFSNGQSGIAMQGYSNIISKNTIQNNYRGIGVGSSFSVVFNNFIAWNSESGIFLAGSNNTIFANDFYKNKWGLYVTPQLAAPRENTIYNNNFINNTNKAYDNSSYLIQNWDKGSQMGGNFWSDYSARYPNATQIEIPNAVFVVSPQGNTPYLINVNNTDNYPLMHPFDTTNAPKMPAMPSLIIAKPNSIVASWSFDTVNPDLVTLDATGQNPAILGSTTANYSYIPQQVPGKFGDALSFTGMSYATVPASPSIETPNEVTIDAWVNVQSLKNVTYNNIFVEAMRTTAALPTRTLGLAINGVPPENTSSPAEGAIRGYVYTQNNGLNEIVTKNPVPLNQWVHIVFTRSLATGMHIYVNGEEQPVEVTAGVANPAGPIQRQTEIYIGHDSITNIDQLEISNVVKSQAQPIWTQWWLWTIISASLIILGLEISLYRTKKNRRNAAV